MYLLVCLGFVVGALFEFALVIFISRISRKTNEPKKMKYIPNGTQRLVLTDKPHNRKLDPIRKEGDDVTDDKQTFDCHQQPRSSKADIFRNLAELARKWLYVIDAICSCLFILAFALFNYIYWKNITA